MSHELSSPAAETAAPMTPGHLLELLALGLVWGGSFLFMRVAAPEFGPLPLIALRVLLATALLVPLLARRGALRAWCAHWRPIAVLGLFNSALPFCLFAYAALSLPAGYTSVLNATTALWGAALGWGLFGQPVPWRTAGGLLLGLVGVAMLVWERVGPAGSGASVAGVAAALAAAACYGASAHYARRRLAGVSPMVVAAGSQATAALVLLPPGCWLWPARAPSAAAWAAALGLGAFSTALAYVLYFRFIAAVGAPRAVTVTLLVPASGVLLGAVVLGEALRPRSALGALAVVAGTALALNLTHLVGKRGRR
jgi:drug/metabolite transporter (DMT)-like permease